jgi:hypothetical protein
MEPLRELVGELQRNGPADGFTHEMRFVNLQIVHEVGHISRKSLERPGIAGCREGGLAEPTGIQADDPELPC